jgi:hypothetical protein
MLNGPASRKFVFVTREVTTWKFRVALVAALAAVAWLSSSTWSRQLGRSLVCVDSIRPVDVILIDNFDQNYLLFERAAALRKIGIAPRVVVPTELSEEADGPTVAEGILDVMIRVSHLQDFETVPIREVEPISLNAAYQIRSRLQQIGARSVAVVTAGFRSRRSFLVYSRVFNETGISVSCVPVFGTKGLDTWQDTWHGIQDVLQQFAKLQYYRFYILPFHHRFVRV